MNSEYPKGFVQTSLTCSTGSLPRQSTKVRHSVQTQLHNSHYPTVLRSELIRTALVYPTSLRSELIHNDLVLHKVQTCAMTCTWTARLHLGKPLCRSSVTPRGPCQRWPEHVQGQKRSYTPTRISAVASPLAETVHQGDARTSCTLHFKTCCEWSTRFCRDTVEPGKSDQS